MMAARSNGVWLAAVMCAAVLGLPGTAAGAPEAGVSRARLEVTATVLKHASLNIVAQPAMLVVTEADVARGHVDVASPVELAIKANTENFLLDFAASGDFMRRIIVSGLANEVQLSPAGGAIAQRSGPRTVSLSFRFVLSENARPGAYPWPMRLSATPL